MDKVKIGVVGCGVVSGISYLPMIAKMPRAELVAVCDQVAERAQAAAAKHNVPQVYTDLDDMLARSGIDMLLDLTPIQAHFEVNMKGLQAGKHVYSEKPIAGCVADATALVEEAKRRSLRLGAAAATMTNPVNQKIAQLLRDGAIGKVCFAISHNSHAGPGCFVGEEWGTDPTWFFKPGAGPMLDMGVYGLHTLTGLLGPARAVAAMSGISWGERTICSLGPYLGQKIDVEVDDNTLLLLDFGNATFAYVDSTFCVRATKGPTNQPGMHIYGTGGTICVDEHGQPSIWRVDEKHGLYGWMDVPLPEGTPRWHLPMGVEQFLECIVDPSKQIIANAEHARHVLEIMTRCYDAAREGRTVRLETTF